MARLMIVPKPRLSPKETPTPIPSAKECTVITPTISNAGEASQSVSLQLLAEQTASLDLGQQAYSFELEATLAGGTYIWSLTDEVPAADEALDEVAASVRDLLDSA